MGRCAGEASFHTGTGGRGGDGCLIVVILDLAQRKNVLTLFKATDLAAGPVTQSILANGLAVGPSQDLGSPSEWLIERRKRALDFTLAGA